MATDKKSGEAILRIRVRAYENKVLDASVKQIIETANRHEATLRGPVPLPNEIRKYTVNRSTFVHKDAREQFEIRRHRRLLLINEPTPETLETLQKLNLPSGVGVDISIVAA